MFKKYSYFLFVLLIGLSISVAGYVNLRKQHDSLKQIRFSSIASERFLSFEETLQDELELLAVLAGFFNSKEHISRTEFNKFAHTLLGYHPDIQALEWIPRVTHAELDTFEQRAKSEGMISFSIKERDATGRMIDVRQRDIYYPVYYVEPLQGNESALGYDLGSSQKRLNALLEAANNHQISTTEPIRLVQEKQSQSAVLILAPIYSQTIENNITKPDNVNGYVLMVLRLEDFFDFAISDVFEDEGIELSLQDVRSGDHLAGNTWWEESPDKSFLYTETFIETEMDLDGAISSGKSHSWRLMARSTPEFSSVPLLSDQNIALLAGIIISLLVAHRSHNQKLQLQTVNQRVQQQTRVLAKSDAFSRQILHSAMDAIITINDRGIITSFNPAASTLFGYDNKEAIGQNVSIIMPPQHRDQHDDYIHHHLKSADKKVIDVGREFDAQRKDGSKFPISVSLSKVEIDNEVTFTGIIHDLSSLKTAQAALKNQKFAMDQHSIIATTNVKGCITYVNDKFCEISGYSEHELIGQNHRLLNSGNQTTAYWKEMYKTVSSGLVWHDEIRNRAKNGHFYWVDTTIVPFLNNKGKPVSYIAIRTDITHRINIQKQLKDTNAQLEQLSETDPLTKIANRRAYEIRKESEISAAKRSKQPLSLLMIDIDYFKQYNDNYGHVEGDVALRRIAKTIAGSLPRTTDLAARFGGEEFVVLAPSTDINGAVILAERILVNVTAQSIEHQFSEVMDCITVSIGISSLAGEKLNTVDLLKQADAALYKAKKAGRNTYQLFS